MTTKNAKKTTSTKSTKSSAKKSAAPKAPKFGPVSHVSLSRTKKAGEYAVTVNGKPAGFASNDAMTGWSGTGQTEKLLVEVDGFEALMNSALKSLNKTLTVGEFAAVADKNAKPSPVAKGNKAVDAKEAKKSDAKKSKKGASKPGSTARIAELVKEGKLDNEAIAEAIRKEFPEAQTNKSNVSWVRWALKTGRMS